MNNEEKALQLAGLKEISEEERYYQSSKCEIYDKCLEMAQWLLSHQWISVDEELPPRNNDITYVAFSEHVIVRIDFEGNIIHRTACYDYANKRWTMYSKFVTHWMPIPPLEGGKE